MEIAVLLEPIHGNGYRATSVTPAQLVTEAPTREEALDRLRELVQQQLSQAEVVKLQVSVPGEEHPWMAFFGKLKDHPDRDEVERNIQEYRQQVDAERDWL